MVRDEPVERVLIVRRHQQAHGSPSGPQDGPGPRAGSGPFMCLWIGEP